MEKVLLVDGNNLLFRSYYATAYTGNVMKNSKGFPTNALYGFVNMMNKIIEEENPKYIMVAFDKGKTFRHEKYKDYKAGRIETPNDLKMQFPLSRELCDAMGIKHFEIDNYEADDIIGTFAEKCNGNKDFDAVIVSSDKDLLQLITDEVEVKLLKQSGSIRMTRDEFKNTYGLDDPKKMVDLKALMGDQSDNIKGVKGIGEKTAISLLQEFGSLDGIYENIDKVKGKTKEKLENGKDDAYDSFYLATIYKEVPIDTNFENIRYKGYNPLKYIEILENLEFYSLIKKLNINKGNIDSEILQNGNKEELKKIDEEAIKENDEEIQTKLTKYEIVTDINKVKIDKDYAIYIEMLGYNYHKSKPLGISIYDKENAYFIPFDLVIENKELLLENTYEKYTYDLKKLLVLLKKNNLEINNCNYDLNIAGYLLNYNVKDDISYLIKNDGLDVLFYEEEFGKAPKLKEPDIDVIAKNACIKAKYIYDTRAKILNKLKEEDEMYLFEKIEMPLTYVLADMELTGIRVDKNYLLEMGVDIKKRIDILSEEIYSISGCTFNIASPKQLGEVLFKKMELPYPKKVKNDSYSTSKDILDKLYPYSPIIEKIEEHRMLSKLYNSYITGLIDEIYDDNRCHTIYNQTLTRTGRLSSQEPNLQNIPARFEYGKLIRKAFLPEDNSIILSSDYSQIELRVFASMCNEKNLIDAFINGNDIHAKTASDIYHKDIKDVTKEERRNAKAVNFGILYGISSFGLADDLGIDFKDAKKFIDDYLNSFPGIKSYMNSVIEKAKENGYTRTLMNRKRIIDEIKSSNYMIRQMGERMALNTPVQGTSADILKKAMVEIYAELERKHLKSKMLIQVHDELVLNVYKDEEEIVTNIVKNIMENTYKLKVPLVVDINKGNDWYDAK